ncbi:MAG: DNA polymerase III subunit delta [Lachnospiraceae bacterium]|nr:DNA polymerase III subunit delta [Lachnospiraceae bacterium]
MVNLNRDIKEHTFKNIYLLFGEEDYLLATYKKRLREAMVREDDSMNYAYFEGKETQPETLIELAETMPFLAERRVIVVENSGFFKSSQEKLAEYLATVPETTVFIFVEKEVDKRTATFKAVKQHGYPAQLDTQSEETLQKWILMQVKREGSQITSGALSLFLQYVGSDMKSIESELEKLFSYTMDKKEITVEDVTQVTSRRIEDHIFDMIESVARQQQMKALDYYYDLLSLKVAPMKILTLINRQFNLMLQARLLREKGYDRNAIASGLNLKPFIAGKYISQSELFSTKRLVRLVEEGCETEEQIKTGRITDKLAVELMLIGYSSVKR